VGNVRSSTNLLRVGPLVVSLVMATSLALVYLAMAICAHLGNLHGLELSYVVPAFVGGFLTGLVGTGLFNLIAPKIKRGGFSWCPIELSGRCLGSWPPGRRWWCRGGAIPNEENGSNCQTTARLDRMTSWCRRLPWEASSSGS